MHIDEHYNLGGHYTIFYKSLFMNSMKKLNHAWEKVKSIISSSLVWLFDQTELA